VVKTVLGINIARIYLYKWQEKNFFIRASEIWTQTCDRNNARLRRESERFPIPPGRIKTCLLTISRYLTDYIRKEKNCFSTDVCKWCQDINIFFLVLLKRKDDYEHQFISDFWRYSRNIAITAELPPKNASTTKKDPFTHLESKVLVNIANICCKATKWISDETRYYKSLER
jgi:hypothetical protein